jgi:hypothetical protein
MKLEEVTLIIPYYRAPSMLEKQLEEICCYPGAIKVVIVDDCSPEPAMAVFDYLFMGENPDDVRLYRIKDDLAWNREGARNLGAYLAETEWIIQIDTDHILPAACAEGLFKVEVDKKHWYLFPRYRVGGADETRKKDAIPDDQEYGRIKPHIDSYLCTKRMYWANGGYNEDYVGCLGGGGPFLKRMRMVGGEPLLMPEDVFLEVHTRHSVPDASVSDLSRDKTEFKRRRKEIGLTAKPRNPLRFKWVRLV